MTKRQVRIACLVLIVGFFCQTVSAQSTEFTYQGRLLSGGIPANGSHDFEFRLFRDSNGNQQVGTPRTLTDVNVNNGVFSVRLDFGDEFPGENRYLEIRVRQAGQQFFTVLAPLQAITSAPYAIKSLNAENANNAANSTNATQLGGVDATQYVLTGDTRMTDARDPLPNSANYIHNSATQQASSNFNITGTGSASILNAATRFDIGGNRVLSVAGNKNVFVGVDTGQNTTGGFNAFFGDSAGLGNTSGGTNSFFGHAAGAVNTSGSANSFFGTFAGGGSTGTSNTFIGRSAGSANGTGGANTLIGAFTNVASGDLVGATAIGFGAVVASNNTIALGRSNGSDTVQVPGSLRVNSNVVIGTTTPTAKLTVSGNGAFNASNAARFDLFNTTANVGYFQHVLNDGRWQLGTGSQTRILIDASGNVGVGTASPTSRLAADGEITSLGATGGRFAANNPNNQNARVLFDWFNDGTADWPRIRYGGNGSGSANGFLIQGPGESTKLAISDNGKVNIPAFLSVGTTAAVHLGNSGCTGTQGSVPGGAIGFNGVSCTNYSLGGDGSSTFLKAPSGAISFLVGSIEAIRVASNGRVSINQPGSGGSTTLCLNSSNQISSCSSSARYKNHIHPFTSGLNLIKRLRPVSFKWKSDGALDFGLVAEEIAELEPLLVSRNRDGAIEGVKYDRVGVVLVNAVQEQQQQIDEQKKEIQGQNDLIESQTMQIQELKKQLREQSNLVESLRKLFCESHPQKDVCRR